LSTKLKGIKTEAKESCVLPIVLLLLLSATIYVVIFGAVGKQGGIIDVAASKTHIYKAECQA